MDKKRGAKIGVIGYTPASINSYEEIIKGLREEGYEVKELLYHKCGEEQWGVAYKDIEGYSEEDVVEELRRELVGLNLVLYNLSGGLVDNKVSKVCKEYGIKSIGNIDTFWEEDITTIIRNRLKGIEQPNIVVVTSKKNKDGLSKVLASKVEMWGNPHTDRLKELKEEIKGIDEEEGVLNFFSQPIGVGANEPTSGKSKDMVVQFERLLKEGYIAELNIYIHPREDRRWYEERGYEVKEVRNYKESIGSEYVGSASSTIIYECLYMGKKGYKYSQGINKRFKNEDFDTYKEDDLKIGGSKEDWIQGINKLLKGT